MIDIHNEARVEWWRVDDATKAEITRQECLGAIVNALSNITGSWITSQTYASRGNRYHDAYRIQPGTEVLPAFTRPYDEMDLTQLSRPFGLLHSETQAALREWQHGLNLLCTDGGWRKCTGRPTFTVTTCYRARPAPKPNMIDRIVTGQPCESDDFVEAIFAAHALIATMSGGDPDLRKAYDEAIK